jgi:putative transposase
VRAAADARDGARSDGAQAEHEPRSARASNVPVPAQKPENRPRKPGLGERITYIPLAQGFAYLVAIIDWHSRLVLAWRLSNTLDTSSCVDALQEALWRYGQPEIFNTDQGAQFTADAFTRVLRDLGVKISMDGKGRCIDNIFVERLWRSLKYEEVYLHAYDSVRDARAGIGRYFKFYNCRRPHQALGYQTPDAYYRGLARAA